MHSVHLPQTHDRVSTGTVIVAAPKPPLPFEKWPTWAKAVSLLRTSADAGVGDTVRRTIGDANSDTFQKWYKKLFGKSCGCKRRHREWNQHYRY